MSTLLDFGVIRAYLFPGEYYFVGSKNTNDERFITLDDELVDEKHAVFKVKNDGRCILLDLSTESGTFVDGQRIPVFEEIYLIDNTIVRLGSTSVKIYMKAQLSQHDSSGFLESNNVSDIVRGTPENTVDNNNQKSLDKNENDSFKDNDDDDDDDFCILKTQEVASGRSQRRSRADNAALTAVWEEASSNNLNEDGSQEIKKKPKSKAMDVKRPAVSSGKRKSMRFKTISCEEDTMLNAGDKKNTKSKDMSKNLEMEKPEVSSSGSKRMRSRSKSSKENTLINLAGKKKHKSEDVAKNLVMEKPEGPPCRRVPRLISNMLEKDKQSAESTEAVKRMEKPEVSSSGSERMRSRSKSSKENTLINLAGKKKHKSDDVAKNLVMEKPEEPPCRRVKRFLSNMLEKDEQSAESTEAVKRMEKPEVSSSGSKSMRLRSKSVKPIAKSSRKSCGKK